MDHLLYFTIRTELGFTCKQQQHPEFEGITCKGCQVWSQDLEQSSTTSNCTEDLSLDPPPCNPATRNLLNCNRASQSLVDEGDLDGKTSFWLAIF